MTDVWQLYESHAEAFDRDRNRSLFERGYLSVVSETLSTGARILDLGCGAGEPIAQFFIDSGFDVTGIDAAPSMIALCARRFPDATWITADMRTLDLGSRFDAILAWNSFFHLDAEAQRAMFDVFARHVATNGLLLFTAGPEHGEAIGDLYGNPLYHASLDPAEYRSLLESSGFSVLRYRAEDPDCGGHTVWLAQAA